MVHDATPNDLLGVISATKVMPYEFPVSSSNSNWIDRTKNDSHFVTIGIWEIESNERNWKYGKANPKGRNVSMRVSWNFVANVQKSNNQNDCSDFAGVDINYIKDVDRFVSSRYLQGAPNSYHIY